MQGSVWEHWIPWEIKFHCHQVNLLSFSLQFCLIQCLLKCVAICLSGANFPSFAASQPSLEAQSASIVFFFLSSVTLLSASWFVNSATTQLQSAAVSLIWLPQDAPSLHCPRTSLSGVTAWGRGPGRYFRAVANIYLQVLQPLLRDDWSLFLFPFQLANGGNKSIES